MTWDDQNDGVWIWYSPFSNSASTHYFWSKHTEAFYPMKFANTELNPLAVRVFDGDDTDDRVIMLGSVNGYVNFLNNDATTDISVNFVSHATLGPFVISSSNQTRMVIKELKALTDADGAAVNYEILLGDTPQGALGTEDASFAGDAAFTAGLSPTHNPNLGGYWAYLKVGNNINTSWALEWVRMRVAFTETDTGRR
jgi:hypothetical protein